MGDLPARELECFFVLAQELHFGRTAQRLYVSQSRVSQLLQSLESRIGGPLVNRTSRRVSLTELGQSLWERAGAPYAAVLAALDETRHEASQSEPPLRLGFQCAIYEPIARSISQLQERHPQLRIELTEIPFADPFSDLLTGRIDAGVILLPVDEKELITELVLSRHSPTLAVAATHPMAQRTELTADDLHVLPLVAISRPAPDYWRRAQSPAATPAGEPIGTRGTASTIQEGLSAVALGHSGMLVCEAVAAGNRRRDIVFVPVSGLPDSSLALVRHRHTASPRMLEFLDILRAHVA